MTADHIVGDARPSPSPEVRSGWLGSEQQIMLEKMVSAIQNDLTDSQRHVVILRFLEEFSLPETAAILVS